MFHFTKAGIRIAPFVIHAYFAWMIKFSHGRGDKYPIEKKYFRLQKLLKRLNRYFDAELIVEGKENIPEGPCVLYPNHTSGFDPVALISSLDYPTTFVAKKEIKSWCFVNRCIEAIEGLYIDREDLKQSLRTMMKVQEDLVNKGNKKWIIFPEGTRNKDPLHNLRPFHHGSFKAAVKANVPIVPVAMVGVGRILKFKPQFKKYPIHIKYLKPLMPEDYKDMTTQQIALYVQNEVDKALNYDLRLKNHRMMAKYKKYRFNKI